MRVTRHYVQSRIKHKVMQLFHAFFIANKVTAEIFRIFRNNHIYKTGVRNKTSSEHKCICMWKFFLYIKEIFSCKYISVKNHFTSTVFYCIIIRFKIKVIFIKICTQSRMHYKFLKRIFIININYLRKCCICLYTNPRFY